MGKKALKRRIAELEAEVTELRRAQGWQYYRVIPSDHFGTGTANFDPCAGCGPVCGNTACPKLLRVTCAAT